MTVALTSQNETQLRPHHASRLSRKCGLHAHLILTRYPDPYFGVYQRRPHGKEGLSPPPGGNKCPHHGVSGDHTGSLTPTHTQSWWGTLLLLWWKGRHHSPFWAGVTRSWMGQWNFHDDPMIKRPPALHNINRGHKKGSKKMPSHSYLGGWWRPGVGWNPSSTRQ